jgi:SAM-dependent methyltransferase
MEGHVMRNRFVREVKDRGWATVLNVGSRESPVSDLGEKAVVTGLDIQAGEHVDVVGDVHEAGKIFAPQQFDAIYSHSTFEHLRRPWVAAAELAKVTRPGGWIFCQTHQSFPLHHYPSDYFRFSTEALREIFSVEAGWRVLACEYLYPCKVIPLDNIFPHARDWSFSAESWLCVACIAERV